jgi:Tol biopolymer transport system component
MLGVTLTASLSLAACGGGHPPVTPVASQSSAPSLAASAVAAPPIGPMKDMKDPRETHLSNVKQLTFGGENAEAYWSFAGDQLIFQTTRAPFKCDQIMKMKAQYGATPSLVSNGQGRTTCSYFLKGDQEVVYASTHEHNVACPVPPDMSKGYVWGLFEFDIYRANADGSNVRKLTNEKGYDAEATVCGKDGSMVFTSMRNGDLDLYRMDADGKNVVQLTNTPGYDGGAFFSSDCSKIVWRASRPTGDALTDYNRLLKENMVRPTKLELFVANADGSDARQITYLGVAAFGPFFHPSGKKIVFATNYPNPKGREFDIWAIGIDGTGLERITWAGGFDGFPMFSPDGKQLAFSSNRRDVIAGPPDQDGKPTEVYRATNTPAGPTDTNMFLADWNDDWDKPVAATPMKDMEWRPDRFAATVEYLAADAREGRGVGSAGLRQATSWLENELSAAGVLPANSGGFRQPFEVTTALLRGGDTKLTVDGVAIAESEFTPFSFSAVSTGKRMVKSKAAVVMAGWGIVDAGMARDDYAGKDVKGKIVVVDRFLPSDAKLSPAENARLSDVRYKAFVAKQRGAIALIVVDSGDLKTDEGKLPPLRANSVGTDGDSGIPVIAITRKTKAALLVARSVDIAVELSAQRTMTDNLVGVISAGAPNKLPGVVVIGAHLDHLGMGGAGSGALDAATGIHNGADDNASGIAALVEVARILSKNRNVLRRDVVIAAFSAEEMGVLGSTYMSKHMPVSGNISAMLNMDMVGRMRGNSLAVLGAESAKEWTALMTPLCKTAGIECTIGGSGYGPSDHMPFYIAGAPVLHFFSGGHLDYHRMSDDAATINAAGGAQVAELVANVAVAVGNREAALTYQKVAAPTPTGGDVRMTGASLGTIPAYNDEPNQPPGATISDVVPDGAGAKAGLLAGDRIIRIGATDIRSLSDMMFVLQNSKPGDTVNVTVVRKGKQLTMDATLTQRRR